MNRRSLLKTSFLALGAALAPQALWASVRPRRFPLSVSQIIRASWPSAVEAHRQGQTWALPEMREAERVGQVVLDSLGIQIQEWGSNVRYQVRQLSTPMVWTLADEARASTEALKITLAAQLIENTINSLEWYLHHEMGKGRMVVSKKYQNHLCEPLQIEAGGWEDPTSGEWAKTPASYVFRVYTVMAFLPKAHGSL